MYQEDFLLNVSKNLKYFCYLKKKETTSTLIIKNSKNKLLYKKQISNIKSLNWLGNNILVQCSRKSYLIDWQKECIQRINNCPYIINEICKKVNKVSVIIEVIENGKYLYYFYNYRENITDLLAVANLDYSSVKIIKNDNKYIRKILKNKINKRYLRFKNYTLKNVGYFLHERKWYLNGILLDKNYFIDKCFLLKNGFVLSINNFHMPSRVIYYSYNDINNCNFSRENKIKFKHIYALEKKLPTFYYHDNKNKNTIIFIHGGPKSSYLPYYNIIIKYFLDLGFNIYLPNYPGSLGYGIEYERMLEKNGGHIEIKYLKKFIKTLKGNIYLYGESYGGYLALLLSLQPNMNIYKTFVVNGFTDINYQLMFSKARKLIDIYFKAATKENVNPINIIDFKKFNCEVVFIHEKKDYICNINQIRMFIDKYKRTYDVLLKLYCLENASHQLEEYDQQLMVLNNIKKEVK